MIRSLGSIFYLSFVFILINSAFTTQISASDEFWGPPFEIGGGIGYVTSSQQPSWSAKNFRTGSVTGAFRIIRGLSIQGGYEGSLGEDISLKSLEYGNNIQLKNVNTSNYYSTSVGIRYETPASILKMYRFKSHSLYASLGYTWARFGVETKEWTDNGVLYSYDFRKKFEIADVSGRYGIIALRYRLSSDFKRNAESWLGAYGFDVGLKYIRYTSCSAINDAIEKSSSDYSSLQVFVIGFFKLSFLE